MESCPMCDKNNDECMCLQERRAIVAEIINRADENNKNEEDESASSVLSSGEEEEEKEEEEEEEEGDEEEAEDVEMVKEPDALTQRLRDLEGNCPLCKKSGIFPEACYSCTNPRMFPVPCPSPLDFWMFPEAYGATRSQLQFTNQALDEALTREANKRKDDDDNDREREQQSLPKPMSLPSKFDEFEDALREEMERYHWEDKDETKDAEVDPVVFLKQDNKGLGPFISRHILVQDSATGKQVRKLVESQSRDGRLIYLTVDGEDALNAQSESGGSHDEQEDDEEEKEEDDEIEQQMHREEEHIEQQQQNQTQDRCARIERILREAKEKGIRLNYEMFINLLELDEKQDNPSLPPRNPYNTPEAYVGEPAHVKSECEVCLEARQRMEEKLAMLQEMEKDEKQKDEEEGEDGNGAAFVFSVGRSTRTGLLTIVRKKIQEAEEEKKEDEQPSAPVVEPAAFRIVPFKYVTCRICCFARARQQGPFRPWRLPPFPYIEPPKHDCQAEDKDPVPPGVAAPLLRSRKDKWNMCPVCFEAYYKRFGIATDPEFGEYTWIILPYEEPPEHDCEMQRKVDGGEAKDEEEDNAQNKKRDRESSVADQLEEYFKMVKDLPPRLLPSEYRVYDENSDKGFITVKGNITTDFIKMSKQMLDNAEEDKERQGTPAGQLFKMTQTLDVFKGNGLEKFLEHNMPQQEDPAVLAGILLHMLAQSQTFGVTEDVLVTVHQIVRVAYAPYQQMDHSNVIKNELGSLVTHVDALKHIRAAIRFVLTRAYLHKKELEEKQQGSK